MRTAAGTVAPAVEGTEFEIGGMKFTVGAKCEENQGQWVCTTHSEVFRNQLGKDSHIGTGSHVLAWACLSHGAEVP
jgi:hypothetical protein